MKTILYIDSQNFIHRARGGFAIGDNPIVFNFFRNLRALIEMHNPVHEVNFVLEGHPEEKEKILSSYKSNRKIDVDSSDPIVQEALKQKADFFRQVDIIHKVIIDHFPFNVCRHAQFECDDTIYNLINRSSLVEDRHHIVVSNDTDFIQLLNQFDNVSVYNPMKKTFFEKPDYDYAMWKSLKGDSCDNIKGIPGIGEKRAEALINDPDALGSFFKENQSAVNIFNENYSLIKFRDWTKAEFDMLDEHIGCGSVETAKQCFDDLAFSSITKEKTWKKYVETFKSMIDS